MAADFFAVFDDIAILIDVEAEGRNHL